MEYGQGLPPARMTEDPAEYSPAFQDEYQRLWHEAAAERDASRAALADARNALERITQLTAADRLPRELNPTNANAAAAGLEPARRLAREVLARLDGSSE